MQEKQAKQSIEMHAEKKEREKPQYGTSTAYTCHRTSCSA